MDFKSEFFAANRMRLLKLTGGDIPIVITANGLLQRSADSTFPFRQDSGFWYLTGIDLPDIILVIDSSSEYLIVPGRSDSRQAFDGIVDTKTLSKTSGIKEILDDTSGWQRLSNRLKISKRVSTLASAKPYIAAHGIYVNPARQHLVSRLRSEDNALDIVDIRSNMVNLRMVKQPVELAAIKQAVAITSQAFKRAQKNIFKAKYEYQIEAMFTNWLVKHGRKHAYEPIVAAGHHACTLHYLENSGKLSEDQLVLIDIGAEVNHYASDISRTYALKPPSKRQLQVWEAVIQVQDFALHQLMPGVTLSECEKHIEQFMGERLRELGLIKRIESKMVRKYFPHATSHFLGLDVHDAADYQRPLESNMVLTVEPGIYIPEEGIGIRIEDDVVITKTGHKNLSESLSRKLY